MAKKKPLQTKNGFPILVEKKPKEKKPSEVKISGQISIDPLKVYETIGKSISNYKLDRIKKEDVPDHKHVYDRDCSSTYTIPTYQLEQAQRERRPLGIIKNNPGGVRLYDPDIAKKITNSAKEFSKKFNANKVSGLYGMIPIQNDDLIKEIKSRKDFEDLFGPLKKVRVQQFRDYLGKCFPSYDTAKVGSKIIATLKNYAYLKSLKGNDRKFIPDAEEITIILIVSYIYDVAKYMDQAPYTVLNTLNSYVFKISRNGSNIEALKIIEQIEALINILEYENLDSGVMDEFHHYDIKIKFLRLLSEPRLDNLMETILKELDGKMKFGYVDGKSDYDAGMFYINMIKKLGLRYISSRSNIEWMFYGLTLKKIRNFMSKDMYRAFVKVILQNLEAYKLKEYNGVEFTTGSNLWYLERTIKVIVELREKKYNKIKKIKG